MSDYREALELCEIDRTPDMLSNQEEMIIQSVPEHRLVTMQSIIDGMKKLAITKNQVTRVINKAVAEGGIVKRLDIKDGRRRLYRRIGVFDE